MGKVPGSIPASYIFRSITEKVPFHIVGMKCGHCGGFNTQEEDRFIDEAPGDDDDHDEENEQNEEEQQQH